MADYPSAGQSQSAWFHVLSKIPTENNQQIYESQYKTGHTIRQQDIWLDDIGYASNVATADTEASTNSAVTKHTLVSLKEVPGSNGQAYILQSSGRTIRDWIAPIDVLHSSTETPSNGYQAKLYQSDNTLITPTEGEWYIDYVSGMVRFYTSPSDEGWGNPKITCYAYTGTFGVTSINTNNYVVSGQLTGGNLVLQISGSSSIGSVIISGFTTSSNFYLVSAIFSATGNDLKMYFNVTGYGIITTTISHNHDLYYYRQSVIDNLFSSYYTKTSSDSRYVLVSGGSYTANFSFSGDLNFSANTSFQKSLYIKELTASASNISTYGQIYSKENELYYVSDTGEETNLVELYKPTIRDLSTGLIKGGVISINTSNSTLIDISSGEGLIVDSTTDEDNPSYTKIIWSAKSGINLTSTPPSGDVIAIYLSLDSSGAIVERSAAATNEQLRNTIDLGLVTRRTSAITLVVNTPLNYNHNTFSKLVSFMENWGGFNLSGNIISSYSSGLTLSKTAGSIFRNGVNVRTNKKSPDVIENGVQSPITFGYKLSDGTDIGSSGSTNIDPNHYDDGSSSLATVQSGRYTIQRISMFANNWVEILYGQETFRLMSEAKKEIPHIEDRFVIPEDSKKAIVLAYLIVKQGATDLTDETQAVFYQVGKTGEIGGIGYQNLNSSGMVFPSGYIDHGDGSISVKEGVANLYPVTNFANGIEQYIIESATFTLTDQETNYVVVNYNSGSPIYQNTINVDIIDESMVIPVYTIFRDGTKLYFLDWGTVGSGLVNKLHMRFVKTQRFAHETGITLAEYGTNNFSLTSGKFWIGGNRITVPSAESTINGTSFWYHDSGVWTEDTSVTTYNITQYDDGTSLQTLLPNRYAVNWIYRGSDTGHYTFYVLGNGDYTLSQAIDSQPPSDLPDIISQHAILTGRIVVEKNATSAYTVESNFEDVFTPSRVTVHSELAGLIADDHPQYVALTGRTAVQTLSGYLSLNSLLITGGVSAVNTLWNNSGILTWQGVQLTSLDSNYYLVSATFSANGNVLKMYYDVTGYGTISVTISHNHDLIYYTETEIDDLFSSYYTKINLQTSGEASVHWLNLTNVPANLTSQNTNYYLASAIFSASANVLKLYFDVTGYGTITTTISHDHDLYYYRQTSLYTQLEIDNMFSSYYTKTQIDNTFSSYYTKIQIDNTFSSYYTKTNIDSNFYTKTNLQISGEASVHWLNLTNLPAGLTSQNTNNYPISATFDNTDGKITMAISGTSSQSSVIVDIDGRYVILSSAMSNGGTYTSNYTWEGSHIFCQSVTLKNANQFEAMIEPTGIKDRTKSTLSWNTATRTITITPVSNSFTIYEQGQEWVITSAKSYSITTAEGTHIVYFQSGVLTELVNPDATQERVAIATQTFVSIIEWDSILSGNRSVLDERHGLQMDGATHVYLHDSRGTQYGYGLSLGNISADGTGTLSTNITLSVANGGIADEDIFFIIDTSSQTLSPVAYLPIFYKISTSGTWRKDDATAYPMRTYSAGSSRLAYNQYIGGTWQQTEVGNGNFVNSIIWARNDILEPVFVTQGQNEYSNISEARQGAIEELNNTIIAGLPTAEVIAIGVIILETKNTFTNAKKARIITTDEGDDWVDLRSTENVSIGRPLSHGDLAGLNNDDHPQYVALYGRTSQQTFSGSISFPSIIISSGASALNTLWNNSGQLIWQDVSLTSLGSNYYLVSAIFSADGNTLKLYFNVTGYGTISTTISHNHDLYYYTKTNLQTSGEASVHWLNLTNAPAGLTSQNTNNYVVSGTLSSGTLSLKISGSSSVGSVDISGFASSYSWNLLVTGSSSVDFTSGQTLTIVDAGDTSVTFNSSTFTLIISSIGGGGGGDFTETTPTVATFSSLNDGAGAEAVISCSDTAVIIDSVFIWCIQSGTDTDVEFDFEIYQKSASPLTAADTSHSTQYAWNLIYVEDGVRLHNTQTNATESAGSSTIVLDNTTNLAKYNLIYFNEDSDNYYRVKSVDSSAQITIYDDLVNEKSNNVVVYQVYEKKNLGMFYNKSSANNLYMRLINRSGASGYTFKALFKFTRLA